VLKLVFKLLHMGTRIYKLAVIGATGTAMKRVIPSLSDSKVCKVVAIQGRDDAKMQDLKKTYNIDLSFSSIDDLIMKSDCDAVYIATPPYLHLEAIQACVNNSKAIICEKPLAQNLEEALKIKQILSQNKDIPFMLAHHLRHQKPINDIKSIISTGQIGDVISVIAQWGFKLNKDDKNALWKLKPELGGKGTLGEQGIHLVDLFLYLFGKPERVLGHSFSKVFDTTYDNETIMFMYKDKTAIANCSQSMPIAGNHLLIYGTTGSIEAYNGIGVKNIESIIVNTVDSGKEEIKYESSENFYRQEIEDFFDFYFNKNSNANKGTTLDESITALELIEEARANQIT
jgi:predicted dehydrogenase